MNHLKRGSTGINVTAVYLLRRPFLLIDAAHLLIASVTLFAAIVSTLFCVAVFADTIIPATPRLDATSYFMFDYHSGHVIAAHDVDKRLPSASLTKVMTVYVVAHELELGKIQLKDQVIVSEKAWRMPGSKMFIEVDKEVSVQDLLKGVIIQSGNDASVALAEFVSGSEAAFVDLMNQYAKKLGLKNTHFVNCTGLPDPQHYTTAKDLALLTQALIRDFPALYTWHSMRTFSFGGIKQRNRNKLLWLDNSVDGVKTGHTEEAGYCLLASAIRDDMRLISVVMGANSVAARTRASQTLLNYGFRFYETYRLYNNSELIDTARVWKGAMENIDLGLDEELYVTVPRGQYNKLQVQIDIPEKIVAPINIGDKLGMLNIELDGAVLLSRPLVALQPVAEGSLLDRLSDSIRLFFE